MTRSKRWLAVVVVAVATTAGLNVAEAQHIDVLIASKNGRLVTGGADFDRNEWTLGRRVYLGEFDGDFAVNNPGYNALAANSPALPAGSQALPGDAALEWDFLPMTIGPHRANLLYWDGLESDGVAGLSPSDVSFGVLPGSAYTLGLFDESGVLRTVNGAPVLAAGGVFDHTGADGWLHRHRFYQLLDNDGSGATLPADGIYLFAMRLRIGGLESAKPIYMAFGTPASSVAALESAAVPWVEARVDTLIGLPGDYNLDGVVDAADYVVWRNSTDSTTNLAADGNYDGVVNGADYHVWRVGYGTMVNEEQTAASNSVVPVPESSTLGLMVAAICCGPAMVWGRGERGASRTPARYYRFPSRSRVRHRCKS